jgi:hypothetical protein
MPPKNKFIHSRPSLLAGQARPKVADLTDSQSLFFCFDHLCPDQGQRFEDWEDDKLLALMLNKFKAYSNKPFHQCFNKKFKPYGPRPVHSEFMHPPYVPEDAIWASMHIQGLECVIGHMVRNVFYVVFLDRHHKFYPTDIQDRGK